MSNGARRPMILSHAWMQGMLLTFLIGFAILGYLALRVYEDHAPVPARVVDEAGKELITGDEIMRGQEAFLTYGLMQFGSVYGHGAYLGPDFTADYLHRMALHMIKKYGGDESARGRTPGAVPATPGHRGYAGRLRRSARQPSRRYGTRRVFQRR